ncbi:hypothetical protein ANCCAN_05738 [Ancylostoma caninum]|uniref:Endonuclease/exonuclease/phosphatase domain-containing protein n=1 Tax=Ancylostoma caninum TaxID=29170 RepID=A0A368GV02_ANCCA|nr:hypothetical protein ANCCAN_05738 [Ancylostoma caninum]
MEEIAAIVRKLLDGKSTTVLLGQSSPWPDPSPDEKGAGPRTRRLAQILQEFDNYQLDILGLSEVRWTGSGCFTSANKTILFSGCKIRHKRGVGFVLNKRALEGRKPVSERTITARLSTKDTRITFIQVYVATDNSEEDKKTTSTGFFRTQSMRRHDEISKLSLENSTLW